MADRRPVLALLDGYSLAFRAFYALPDDLRTTTGQVTNAVYGFTSMLIKLLAEHDPDGLAAVFDEGRPVERTQVLPTYKANRTESPDAFKSQVPLIDEVLRTMDVPRLSVAGNEADDVIASYCRSATELGWDVLVVTGDRDAFQLIDDHVTVLYTRRGISDTVLMDAAAVEERYGVEPARYPMLAALRGDPSDNIPGVPGIGDKTAAKLLVEHGDLDGIYANLDDIKGKKVPAALLEHHDTVRAGFQVAVLRRDLPLPAPIGDLARRPMDPEAVRRVFNTLEFRSLWERLSESVFDAQAERHAGAFEAEPAQLDPGALADRLAALPLGHAVSVLPFTEGRLPDRRATAWAFATEGEAPVVIAADELDVRDRAALARLLGDPHVPKHVHDLKALLHVVRAEGWTVDGVVLDTELAAYLIAPQTRGYDLERLAIEHLHKHLATDAPVAADVPAQLAMALDEPVGADGHWREQALRAQALHELAGVLAADLAAREQEDLLRDVELPLVPVLVELERSGITVRHDVLEELADTLADQISAARAEVFTACGREFNLDSPKQLQQLLFDELKLPKTKRMKTGWSTDAVELQKLVDHHPLVTPLLRYREVSKLKGTYVDALPPLINPRTGRIHAEFNQTVAVTGRLSSQNPNLQNIPIRSAMGREIRRAFVPGDGFTAIVLADYSQIELRVMAHLSQDPGLLDAFRSGEDVHASTASKVWGIPVDEVDGAQRAKIKGMTYGLAYGLSAFGLSQQLQIAVEEAQELQDAYFTRFPGVRDYLQGGVEQARRVGYTATLIGRRRYLPDLVSDNRQRRQMAERMALNAPIQGTAADIIKLAMIEVRRRMEGMRSQLLLQVHDELVCEAAPGEEESLRDLLVEAMSGVLELSVPLVVDTAAGPSWAEAEKH